MARAALYAQPGGGTLAHGYKHLRCHRGEIRAFVHAGGRYLGFCLGGYIAGSTPGFGVLPGNTDQYITSPEATVASEDDTLVEVAWLGRRRTPFFQDGSYFWVQPNTNATVVATYPNGTTAALVVGFGQGRVGVVEPHPEATRNWYTDAALAIDRFGIDLGLDLHADGTDRRQSSIHDLPAIRGQDSEVRTMKRRNFLISASTAGILAGLTGGAGVGYASSRNRPLALVYRGPASYPGCSEAVAALLTGAPTEFRIQFCGPDENVQLSADALAAATIYAQPGGGDVTSAWRSLRAYSDDVRDFVHNGGHYLGFCLGAYLAGGNPGFGLLTGVTVGSYIRSANASVRGTDGAILGVTWRDQRRHMYFQDGAHFRLQRSAPATVLATYDTGAAAAVITTYGAGRVGLVGPHPEADQSWYTGGMANPDGIRFDLGHDLIESTIH
ncbi:hypothetical protein GCM10009827_115060 [Dactylosporangium maewongense]|uniref:Biotin-protein ligase N-terminal domain-containing protein n=1 Tax=Dactylosporangium maewongense TaxID=634393 RepID=A0ABP4P5E6_9ACTN